MKQQQAELIERVRASLADEPSTREVSMFGGRSFMLNDKMIASALAAGDLLIRIAPERHDELAELPGAAGRDGSRTDHGAWLDLGLCGIDHQRRTTVLLDRCRPGAQPGHN